MEGKSEQMKTLSDISIEVRDLIAKISKLLDKNERNAIRSHGVQGLTPPQLFLLRQLWFQEENQGYSCNRLADISHVSRATITGIIDTMEKEGYVKRTINPSDRRSLIIKITQKGRALKKYNPPIDSEKLNYFQDFSPKELDSLINLLRKLYDAVNFSELE